MGGEDNSLREAFDKTPYSNKYYPYLLKESNSFIIIEDSTINYGEIQDGLVNLINKIPTESSIFVFRHHIPIVELSPYSNTSINKSFSSLNELKDLVSKKVTFISEIAETKFIIQDILANIVEILNLLLMVLVSLKKI